MVLKIPPVGGLAEISGAERGHARRRPGGAGNSEPRPWGALRLSFNGAAGSSAPRTSTKRWHSAFFLLPGSPAEALAG